MNIRSFVLWVLVMVCCMGCQIIRSKNDSESPTLHAGSTLQSHAAKWCAWQVRKALDDYNKHGVTNAIWDGEAKELIMATFCMRWSTWSPLTHDKGLVVWRLSEDLRRKGCSDPLVAMCRGNLMLRFGDAVEARAILKDSYQGMVANHYSAPILFEGSMSVFMAVWGHEPWLPWIEKVTVLMPDLFLMHDYEGDMCRLQYSLFVDIVNHWDTPWAIREEMCKRIESNSAVNPWLRLMVEGMRHRVIASEARGTSWASRVNQGAWTKFSEEMKASRLAFERAYELCPQYPEAAFQLCDIAGSTGRGKELRLMFDRAVAAQFDYAPAYDAMLNYLRPRWGGSHEALYRFGEECLNTGRFDTCVPEYFLSVLKAIDTDNYGGVNPDARFEAYKQPNVKDNLNKYFTGMLARISDNTARCKHETEYGIYLWAAGAYEDAKRVLGRKGKQLSDEAFAEFPVSRQRVMEEIEFLSGHDGRRLLSANTLNKEGHYRESVQKYLQLIKVFSKQPAAQAYIYRQIAGAGLSGKGPEVAEVAKIMAALGLRERLLLDYLKLKDEMGPSGVSAELTCVVEMAVGKAALTLAQATRATKWGLSEMEISESFKSLDNAVEKYKSENGIASVTNGSPLDSEIKLASLRMFLHYNMAAKNEDDLLNSKIMPLVQTIASGGLVVDCIGETGRMIINQEGPFVGKLWPVFQGRILARKETDKTIIDKTLEELKSLGAGKDFETACWNAWWANGSTVLALRVGQLLRERGQPNAALMMEERGMVWPTLISETFRNERWSLWHSMMAFSRVKGYENITIDYGRRCIKVQETETAYCVIAKAYLSKGSVDEAARTFSYIFGAPKQYWGVMEGEQLKATPDEIHELFDRLYKDPRLSKESRVILETAFAQECGKTK